MQADLSGVQDTVYQQIYTEKQSGITEHKINHPIPELRSGRAYLTQSA
jgi:hypothetical protein